MIDHERGVRQQSFGADRGRVHGCGVDGDVLDRLPELRGARTQPLYDRRGGAPLRLPQQPLVTVEVDEAGVPRIDRTHLSTFLQYSHLGFPRRVSSIPRTRTGVGSAR